MDGDMRRPHVHDVMGLERQPGLSNLLHGTAKPSEAVRPTSVRNLWVLPAGGPSSNAAKLLASERFTQVLATLADHFDWIVVDTPPVIAVADPSIVANRAGGVLFVVGCHMTQRATALQAIEQLRSARANVLGGVLNRADLRRDPYYYSRYYQPDDVDYYRETRLDA
jgi:capsular exopolysaccharide synthesis family protein